MIETGWPARLVQTFSPAKLFQVFEQSRMRKLRRELRDLINATAASAGGKAAQERFRQIERELRREERNTRQVEGEPQCETPLSAADFERMMKEENG